MGGGGIPKKVSLRPRLDGSFGRPPVLHLSPMEPHGQSPWYLFDIPSYAKASEGYPPAAESSEASMFWPMNSQRSLTHSSAGKTRGLLRRWMKPHGRSPWYLFDIPSYACLREAPPAKALCGGQALRQRQAKASEGYPPAAESTEASVFWPMNSERSLTHSSAGKTRGLLRRWIKLQGLKG